MVSNDEIIKRLKIIKYNLNLAVDLHDRAALSEGYEGVNKLLIDLGVKMPVSDSYLDLRKWLK